MLDNELALHLQEQIKMLKEYNTHLFELANASEDMVAYINADLCYIVVNQAYAQFHNKPTSSFSNMKVKDVIGEVNFEQLVPIIKRALDGETFSLENNFVLPDNSIRYEEVIFKPVNGSDESIIGCIAIIKDISKLKKEYLNIEESLAEQNELFQVVNNENPDIILIRDYDGKFLFVNHTLAKLYNTTPDEMLGKTDESFNPNKEQRDFYLRNIRQIMDNFETLTVYEDSTDVATGETRHYRSIKKPLKDKDGNLQILVIAHDVTDIRKNELKLQQFAAVTKYSREGVMIVDTHKNIVAINESFTTITGYTEEDAIGQKAAILQSGEHDKEFYNTMWESLQTSDRWSGEIWNRHKDNTIYPEWLTISTIRDKSGKIINYVGIFSDLTGEKASEEKINFLALHDTLTGLTNRYQFENRLEHAILSREHHQKIIAVLFLDLDNFKDINDTYGHETGDKVLKSVAKTLKTLLRKEDTLARFGGDEFVVLLEHLQSNTDASSIAQKIIDTFQTPIHIEEQMFHLSFSIGIALYPEDGEDKSTLLQAADVAMYKAKNSGKNCFSFYRLFTD